MSYERGLTDETFVRILTKHAAVKGVPYVAKIQGDALISLILEVQEARSRSRRPTNGEIVHIVGPGHIVGPVHRQICAWCGFVLINEDARLVASSDGRGPMFWPENKLITVTAFGMSVIDQGPDSEVPPNCCAAPVPSPPPARSLQVAR